MSSPKKSKSGSSTSRKSTVTIQVENGSQPDEINNNDIVTNSKKTVTIATTKPSATTNKPSHRAQQKIVLTSDAVTMTSDEDFLNRQPSTNFSRFMATMSPRRRDDGTALSASPDRPGETTTTAGSNFINNLFKQTQSKKRENVFHQNQQRQDQFAEQESFSDFARVDSGDAFGKVPSGAMSRSESFGAENDNDDDDVISSSTSGGLIIPSSSAANLEKRPSGISGAITIASRRSSLASGLGIGIIPVPPSAFPLNNNASRPHSSRSGINNNNNSNNLAHIHLHEIQGPRGMMRPSEHGMDVGNDMFPKMKISGVDIGKRGEDSDVDFEAQKILHGLAGSKAKPGVVPSGASLESSQTVLQREKQLQEEKVAKQLEQDANEVDQEDRLLKMLQNENRKKAVAALPDEVLTLVRKLRTAADIIGSSEGSPPPDSLREVAIHSASLARFVSTWTLTQLHEKDSLEASLQRQWLSDAARQLRNQADNFAWATATNSPIFDQIMNLNQTTSSTYQQVKSCGTPRDKDLLASGGNANKPVTIEGGKKKPVAPASNKNMNSESSSSSSSYKWPKSYAAVTANLGPWILSTLYLIMDSLLHTVQCDRGAIFVPDDAGRLVSVCLVGAGGIARPIRVNRGHGVVGEVFRSGVAVNVLNTDNATKRNEEIFTRDVDNTTGFYTRNLLAIPVFCVGQDIVGVEEKDTQQQQRQGAHKQSAGGNNNNNNTNQNKSSNSARKENQPSSKEIANVKTETGVDISKALVGKAKVVAVIELINKLVPADGDFTPSDELLVAQVGSVVASMLAACGGILQLGTETALRFSSELQAKVLAMRPAVIKARKQFLTATTGGCDTEESSTGRYSFTQVLHLHEEQRARERNIALMLQDETSATDLSKCGATKEKIQQISRIGGASTKVLRVGGGDGMKSTLEVERALQDMASFVGRIEAAWAGTRERCVMAEAEAAASRIAYFKLEAELLELKRLAHSCGILKIDEALLTRTSSMNNNNRSSSRNDQQQQQNPMSRTGSSYLAQKLMQEQQNGNANSNINDLVDETNPTYLLQQARAANRLHNHQERNNEKLTSRLSDDDDTGSSQSPTNNNNSNNTNDDHQVLERLLYAGDPVDSWESSRGAFLDFFQSKTAGYRKAAAVETMQARNLQIMKEKASTSTVGKTIKEIADRTLTEHLMRCGDAEMLLNSALSTRHRHRVHHNRSIKERAEVDPLSMSCKKLKDHVSKQESEMAALVAKHQQETRQLYLELLANPVTNGVKEESYFEDTTVTTAANSSRKFQQEKQKQMMKNQYSSGKFNNGVDGVGDDDVEAENAGFRLLAQEFIKEKGTK